MEKLSLYSNYGSAILMGMLDENTSVIAYFLTSTKPADKNRIFVAQDDDIIIKPINDYLPTETDTKIYSPIVKLKNYTLIANASHINAVGEYIFYGDSFYSALKEHSFENDAPIFTPKITGIVDTFGRYIMGIIKQQTKDTELAQRIFYEYEPQVGIAHLLYTYQGNTENIEIFTGEPSILNIPKTAEELADNIWDLLNIDTKISLVVRAIDLNSGEYKNIIINNKN